MRARRARAQSAEAIYARFLDGEHVWLAVRGADELVLRLPDGSDLPVPTEPGRDGDDDVAVARFPVAAAFADDPSETLELPLLHLTSKGAQPVAHAATLRKGPALPSPATGDRRWQYAVASTRGRVVITRKPVAPGVEVSAILAPPDRAVVVRLDTTETVAALKSDGAVLRELPIVDGELTIDETVEVARETTAVLEVGGLPLLRRRNVMAGPQGAVLLPQLPSGLQLRWVAGGRLALHQRAPGGAS